MKGKKANAIAEGLTILVVLFVLVLIIIIGNKIFTEVNTEIQADPDIDSTAKDLMTQHHNQYSKLWDGIFIFILVLLWIGGIIFSTLVDTHRIFLVITLILLVAVLFIAAILSNAFADVTADAEISTASANFPMTTFVMNHLVETILVIATTIAIALFAKPQPQ